jgi:exportin-1
MKLLILLSEEINVFWKNSLTAKKAYELREKMSKEFIEVFNLCQLIMNNSNSVSKNLLIKAIQLFAEYMNWFPINLTLNQEIMKKTLMNFKDLSSCRTETMKCLGNLFGIKMKNLSQNEINNYRNLLIQMYQTFIQIMDTQIVKDKNFADQYKYIQENQQNFITGFDIYNTMGNIIYGDNYDNIPNKTLEIDSCKSTFGISLFNKINSKERLPRKFSSISSMGEGVCY